MALYDILIMDKEMSKMKMIMIIFSMIFSVNPILSAIFAAGVVFSYMFFNSRPRSAIDDSMELAERSQPYFIPQPVLPARTDGGTGGMPLHEKERSSISVLSRVSRELFRFARNNENRYLAISPSGNAKILSVAPAYDQSADDLYTTRKRPLFFKRNSFNLPVFLRKTDRQSIIRTLPPALYVI